VQARLSNGIGRGNFLFESQSPLTFHSRHESPPYFIVLMGLFPSWNIAFSQPVFSPSILPQSKKKKFLKKKKNYV
jgi:hypothetical protein